jgi:hypothetical protein
MIQRIRRPSPDGDIKLDRDLGVGYVRRSSLAAHNIKMLNEAIPPRAEHLTQINKDEAAKHDPLHNPVFRGPI